MQIEGCMYAPLKGVFWLHHRMRREAEAAAEGRDMAGGGLRTNIADGEEGEEEEGAAAGPYSVLPDADAEAREGNPGRGQPYLFLPCSCTLPGGDAALCSKHSLGCNCVWGACAGEV